MTPREEEIAMISSRWAAVRKVLSPEAAAAISAVHRELSFDCAAAAEGQYCCLDHLLDETL